MFITLIIICTHTHTHHSMWVGVWELPTIWVLETEHRSLGELTTIFTHLAIPPAQKRDFQKDLFFIYLFVCFICVGVKPQ